MCDVVVGGWPFCTSSVDTSPMKWNSVLKIKRNSSSRKMKRIRSSRDDYYKFVRFSVLKKFYEEKSVCCEELFMEIL